MPAASSRSDQTLKAPPLRSGIPTSVAAPLAPIPLIPVTVLSSSIALAVSQLLLRCLCQCARNHHALNLVRSLVDLRDLSIAHHPLDRELFHVPIAAKHLDGVIRDRDRRVGGERLGDGRLAAEALRPRIHQLADMVDE